MKKILLAFDGGHYSVGALEFAKELNNAEPIMLAGAFLPQIDFSSLWSHSGGGKAGNLFIPTLEDENAEMVKVNMDQFSGYCTEHKIDFRIHKDFYDFALPELRKETRFADLLIISSETFYGHLAKEPPNDYLKEILHSAECPILVIPENFEFPRKNILAYDGTEASVYAIKQFTYLFPQFANNETVLFHLKAHEEEVIPQKENISELASRHFKNLDIVSLKLDYRHEFLDWLSGFVAPILVSGSFSRSAVSGMFKKSFVTGVIGEHKVPVFVAHR